MPGASQYVERSARPMMCCEQISVGDGVSPSTAQERTSAAKVLRRGMSQSPGRGPRRLGSCRTESAMPSGTQSVATAWQMHGASLVEACPKMEP
jgi:hypothetical protein